jgi:KUP system potassium uptake protein
MDHHRTAGVSRITAGTLLVALGIIYGDIGTSPLYALRAVVGERPVTETLVYGGVSCIFWTLVFQTTIKYIWLTLKADNQGEGGVFSLYALVRKYGRRLTIPTILGAATLLADGIITPPVSVASAVEGLKIVNGLEHMQTSTVVIIVIAILSLIFFFQRFGTEKIGKVFGPVMGIWFLMLLVLGVSQIARFPSVLQSLNPVYAYDFLTQEDGRGFWLLGAVFLCTTGAEALYSDLGHCGKKNIRITWAFVKVCLVANYMGQAAWIMHSGYETMHGHNPFFEIMPSWFLLTGVIIATCAAIIASQALISGSFTLISEAMNLNFWPRVTVRQPTETKGQIYIPSVNTILWAGCILIILYFQTSSKMEAAYGLAITLAMMMTTVLLAHFLRYRLRWNKLLVAGMLVVFALIELSFFVANIIKFKDGGFITVIIAGVFFAVMYIVYFGRKINNRFTKFIDLGKYTQQIIELSEDDGIPKFSTHLIYLTKANKREEMEEKIINSIFAKKPKRADVYWFVHINRTNQPYCLDYEVSELIDDKVIKITVNIGFRVQPRTEYYFKKIVQDLVANKELNLHIRPDGSTKYNAEPDFKFVVIEKFLSVENEFALREGLLLNAYFFLKRLGQSDEKAFGLDKSDVAIEHIPLVYQPINNITLTRKK